MQFVKCGPMPPASPSAMCTASSPPLRAVWGGAGAFHSAQPSPPPPLALARPPPSPKPALLAAKAPPPSAPGLSRLSADDDGVWGASGCAGPTRSVSIFEFMKAQAASPREGSSQADSRPETAVKAHGAWAKPESPVPPAAAEAADVGVASGGGTDLKAILAEQAEEAERKREARSLRLASSPGAGGKWGAIPEAAGSGAWLLDAQPLKTMEEIFQEESRLHMEAADEEFARRLAAEETAAAAAAAKAEAAMRVQVTRRGEGGGRGRATKAATDGGGRGGKGGGRGGRRPGGKGGTTMCKADAEETMNGESQHSRAGAERPRPQQAQQEGEKPEQQNPQLQRRRRQPRL